MVVLYCIPRMNDEWLVKLLIAFRAKTSVLNKDKCLPVDLAKKSQQSIKVLASAQGDSR